MVVPPARDGAHGRQNQRHFLPLAIYILGREGER